MRVNNNGVPVGYILDQQAAAAAARTQQARTQQAAPQHAPKVEPRRPATPATGDPASASAGVPRSPVKARPSVARAAVRPSSDPAPDTPHSSCSRPRRDPVRVIGVTLMALFALCVLIVLGSIAWSIVSDLFLGGPGVG